MKRTTLILIHFMLLSPLTLSSSQVLATISVIDSANLSNSGKQVAAWAKQIEAMKHQLEQTKAQYRALTGSRGLGAILHNPALRKFLPDDYKSVYDAANSMNHGISGSIEDIIRAEKLTGSIQDIQKNIESRSLKTTATNKAIGLKAYEGSKKRLEQIEGLMHKISETQDLKAIGELQARIEIEQASIQSEGAKLQMIRQLQIAEKDLIKEQKREMSRRLLDSNNKEMPKIK